MAHTLSGIRLLADLTDTELDAIEGIGEWRSYEVGDTIFAEGNPGTHLYLVVRGRAEISVSVGVAEQAPVHVSDAGSCFGEFVLFQRSERSATTRALEATRILAVEAAEIEELFQRQPAVGYRVMHNLCQILVGRMGKTTESLRSSLMW